MTACPFCSSELTGLGAGESTLTACRACLNPVLVTARADGLQASALPGSPDVREAAVPGSLGGQILGSLQDAAETLPVLPDVAQRVMTMARDVNVGLNDMAEVMGEDAVVAAKVLHLANSALYGGLSEVKDLRTACARLGVKQVANVVQAVTQGNMYSASTPAFRNIMHGLWRHSVASAYSAQAVAGLLAEPNADTLFVAGLVHDIGKTVVVTVTDRIQTEPLSTLRSAPGLLMDVLSAWHPLVGLHTTCTWKLPNEFGVCAYYHRNPDTAPVESWRRVAHIVSLGSAMADAAGHRIQPKEDISLVAHPSSRYLGLNDMKLAMLRVDIEDKLQPLFDLVCAA